MDVWMSYSCGRYIPIPSVRHLFSALVHFTPLKSLQITQSLPSFHPQYATWTAENRRQYVQAKVVYIGELQSEVHVELLRNELCHDTADIFIEKVMQDCLNYQDQFEVYIQTLISQALDANFLVEIMQERG